MREYKRPAIRKIHINLTEEAHQKLRIKCAMEDLTIQDYVAGLIEESLKDTDLPDVMIKEKIQRRQPQAWKPSI